MSFRRSVVVLTTFMMTTIGTMGVATAQSTDSTTTTARMAMNSNAVTTQGSPANRTGTWVFLGICAVIVIGAVVLFVRHRRSLRT